MQCYKNRNKITFLNQIDSLFCLLYLDYERKWTITITIQIQHLNSNRYNRYTNQPIQKKKKEKEIRRDTQKQTNKQNKTTYESKIIPTKHLIMCWMFWFWFVFLSFFCFFLKSIFFFLKFDWRFREWTINFNISKAFTNKTFIKYVWNSTINSYMLS